MRFSLLLLLLLVACSLSGCISLGQDERLTEIAQEEWLRSGPPDMFRYTYIRGKLCIGSPAARGHFDGTLSVYVPWPWNYCEFMTRIIMRYELSKVAWQLHGAQLVEENGPYAAPVTIPICMYMWLDAVFHLPTSELHSWYRSLFPGEIQK